MPTDRAGRETDLQAIRGVGPKIEARLKAAGVTTLQQLARTPVNELVTLLGDLRPRYDADRITREGWLAQAARLAAATAEEVPADAGRYRHNFTAEVHLEVGSDDVISSKVVHVQTGDEETWRGWDAERLVRFIEDRAGVAEPGTSCEPGGLALRAFAVVAGRITTKQSTGAHSSFTAMVTIPAVPIALERGRARAAVDVFARPRRPEKSALLGRTEAEVDLSVLTDIGLACQLSSVRLDDDVFATVRLFAPARPTEPSVHQLADVRMEIVPHIASAEPVR